MPEKVYNMTLTLVDEVQLDFVEAEGPNRTNFSQNFSIDVTGDIPSAKVTVQKVSNHEIYAKTQGQHGPAIYCTVAVDKETKTILYHGTGEGRFWLVSEAGRKSIDYEVNPITTQAAIDLKAID